MLISNVKNRPNNVTTVHLQASRSSSVCHQRGSFATNVHVEIDPWTVCSVIKVKGPKKASKCSGKILRKN